jgi:hypothetical protein
MEPIAVHFKEDRGLVRKGEFVIFGVPVRRGQADSHSIFILSNPQYGDSLPCQIRPLAYWPDGSLRWLQLCTMLDMEPREQLILHLCARDRGTAEYSSSSFLRVKSTSSDLYVETGALCARIALDELRWSIERGSTTSNGNVSQEIVLTDDQDQACQVKLEDSWKVAQHSDLELTLEAKGGCYKADDSFLARLECYLHFFASSNTLVVETCIHNPRRSHHSGGLWDLGDPGSVHFKSLEIQVTQLGTHTAWLQPEIYGELLSGPAGDGIRVYQDSSGGEHWDSRNHIDAEGNRTVGFCGYQVKAGEEVIMSGERATPIAGLIGSASSVQASVKQFWQNFPSALSVRDETLTIGLFPANSTKPYELQGGERKTLTAYLHYGDDPEALLWTQAPLVPVIEAQHYEQAKAFPWFRADREPSALDALIQQGMDGPRNFFAKREQIDEYGWRNFGDVFADHETHYQNSGEAPLISHYNNQYDAILGFARQFALTGDRRWFELMDDLARHVTDIDIYHTLEDRGEYNGGLFWHTDHYLDAHTATHRTFTRHNDTSSTPGQTGGGPASEHCYTTGLLYHYYITGAEASRDAVLQLAHWMTAAHEGQGGLLEQLLALKKNELPQLKALARGERPLAHRYPFTRGTGNYLNILLDAWLIQPEEGWLRQAEGVIRSAIHPQDNIDERDLLDVETGWSYLILLAGITRYIALKEERGERDAPYWYARRSFLRYAEWMRLNERPFLADTEQLEFANDTWVAQDVRKAMLMFQAANLGISDADAYYAKGSEWLEYVCNRLQVSDEAEYSRILIILLQNYGPHHLEPASEEEGNNLELETDSLTLHKPYLTWNMLMARVAQRLLRGIRTFRPSREKAWLNARLDKL